MFIAVDLPAPFSPMMAWIERSGTAMLRLRLATTSPNRLVMPRISTAYLLASLICGQVLNALSAGEAKRGGEIIPNSRRVAKPPHHCRRIKKPEPRGSGFLDGFE